MKINLFIIHGYNGDTTETFGPDVENEARKRGLETFSPLFPSKELASYESWSKEFDKYTSEVNEKTIIVAHSLGALFIPRYLAEHGLSIGLYISLAGFLNDHSGREDLKKAVDNFKPSEKQIDEAISLMKKKYALFSNNDHLNPQGELEYYADRLQSKKIFISNVGHMGRKSGVKQIPQIMEIINDFLVEKRSDFSGATQ